MFKGVFWLQNSSVRFREVRPKETTLNGPICVCQRKRKRRFSQRRPRSVASTPPRKWLSCLKSRRGPSRTGLRAGSCQPCAMVVSCGFGLKTWRSSVRRSEDVRNWRNVYLEYTSSLKAAMPGRMRSSPIQGISSTGNLSRRSAVRRNQARESLPVQSADKTPGRSREPA